MRQKPSILASAQNSNRRMRASFFTALLLTIGLFAPISVRAELSAIVVDVQKILDQATAAKSIQKQLEQIRETYRTQIAGEEKNLRGMEQALVTERATLKPEIYAQKEQELRDKVRAMEQKVQERRRTLETAFTGAMNTVRDTLVTVVKEIAEQRKAQVVLVKQQVIWMDPALDATPEVLKLMDARLPDVKVSELPPPQTAENMDKP